MQNLLIDLSSLTENIEQICKFFLKKIQLLFFKSGLPLFRKKILLDQRHATFFLLRQNFYLFHEHY